MQRTSTSYKLNVEPLYWGVRRTFESLLRDPGQMARVDVLLEDLEKKAAGQTIFTKASSRRARI